MPESSGNSKNTPTPEGLAAPPTAPVHPSPPDQARQGPVWLEAQPALGQEQRKLPHLPTAFQSLATGAREIWPKYP